MNINVYSKYKVYITHKGANIDEENSEPNDIVFKYFDYSREEVLDGYSVVTYITTLLNDRDFQALMIKDNTITIEHFNPTNGESCTYTWLINEVK